MSEATANPQNTEVLPDSDILSILDTLGQSLEELLSFPAGSSVDKEALAQLMIHLSDCIFQPVVPLREREVIDSVRNKVAIVLTSSLDDGKSRLRKIAFPSPSFYDGELYSIADTNPPSLRPATGNSAQTLNYILERLDKKKLSLLIEHVTIQKKALTIPAQKDRAKKAKMATKVTHEGCLSIDTKLSDYSDDFKFQALSRLLKALIDYQKQKFDH